MVRRIINKIKREYHEFRERRFLNKNIHLVQASTHKSVSEDVTITCLLQNGANYIPSFMDYHQKMGFQKFIFIDNNSTDNSIDLLKQYKGATIYSSTLPYSKYKWIFKQFLTKKVGSDKWSLYLDIDELWDYPFSDKMPLPSFVAYLNNKNYTGVMAQMLDMFPDTPLSEVNETGVLLEDYSFYDIEGITKTPYTHKRNTLGTDQLSHHRAGIHNTVFEIDNIYLTKIPLIKWNKKIKPHITSHTSDNIHIADFSTVLYHFKFTRHFFDKTKKVIADGSYWNGSETYKRYEKVLVKNPKMNMMQPTSKKLKSVDELIEQEFLVVSKDYRAFANKKK